MKRILIISLLATMAYTGCKKKEATLSTVATVSHPTVTLLTPQFYSFTVDGAPLPNAMNDSIGATAYDSFYREKLTPKIDFGAYNSVTPGLYVITVSAKNSHGFVGYNYVYVAITNITDAINLGGNYVQQGNMAAVTVTKMARGLYKTNNVAGLPNTPANASLIVPAYFAQLTSTTLSMPTQPTSVGPITGVGAMVSMVPADTTFQYQITNNVNFSSNVLMFKKQ